MSQSVAVRPRFQIEFGDAPDVVMNRVRSRLKECPRCTGMSVGMHAELFILEEDRHVWSPHLSVTAEPDNGGTRLEVRIGPHPNVWTWYMFCTFAMSFALFVGLSFAYAQWVLGNTPWALMSLPLCAAGGGVLYLSSLIGQRLGSTQIDGLIDALHVLSSDEGSER